jgi:hypothetical protein
MILILTNEKDEHADHVINMLAKQDVASVRFDSVEFPQRASISVQYGPQGACRQLLRSKDASLDLNSVKAVWYRRPGFPVASESLPNKSAHGYVTQECYLVLQGLWAASGAAWLPGPPAAVRYADQKILQLQIAAKLGFELPPTLITNYPADLLDFYSGHEGQIVSKLAGSAFVYHVGLGMVRFTELVSKRDIASYQAVAHCPTIFQCYIEKQLELRITVVGEHVFAAEIHSQATNHTRYDWRRFDSGRTPYHIHALPSEVAQQCIALVRHFGLSYGAIDMILTPDGRYVFLEINPNGQYLWIEEMTSMPISAAICDFLIKGNVASCND